MSLDIQTTDTEQKAALRHQVEETRSDLADKLELIEHQVAGMVHGATESVTETIASVKESVGHTVDAVQEAVHGTVDSMKHALDWRHHIRQHPWLMLGAAVVLGFACGRYLSRR